MEDFFRDILHDDVAHHSPTSQNHQAADNFFNDILHEDNTHPSTIIQQRPTGPYFDINANLRYLY